MIVVRSAQLLFRKTYNVPHTLCGTISVSNPLFKLSGIRTHRTQVDTSEGQKRQREESSTSDSVDER